MDLNRLIYKSLWKHDNMIWEHEIPWRKLTRRIPCGSVYGLMLTRCDGVWQGTALFGGHFCYTCPSLSVWATVVFYLSYFGLLKPETQHARSFVIYDLFYMYWRCDLWVMSPSLHAASRGQPFLLYQTLAETLPTHKKAQRFMLTNVLRPLRIFFRLLKMFLILF